MKLRSLAQFAAFSLSSFWAVAALASDAADLRPSWAAAGELPPNASLLFSNHDPAFVSPDFSTRIFSASANRLKQEYDDRNRDYQMRESYGIATQQDERTHNQAMKEVGKNVLFAARSAQGRQFGQNFREAEKTGQVSKPIQVIGGAAALGMGTPVDVKISDNAKATWHGDLLQKHGQLDVRASDLNAKVEMSGKPEVQDKYLLTLSKPLVFDVNSSFAYGGTTSMLSAGLSRQIYDRISGTVGTSRASGTSPSEETVGLSYGINF